MSKFIPIRDRLARSIVSYAKLKDREAQYREENDGWYVVR